MTQKQLVELSLLRSGRSQERRDETAVHAKTYAHARTRVSNVVPMYPRPIDPRPAA